MGRTKQSKDVSNRMVAESNKVNNQYDTYNARFQPLIEGAQTRANDTYNSANSTLGSARDNYNKFLASSTGFGKPEGYYDPSAENVSRMRGSGVFDEFAKTGGVSADDKSLMRNVGNANIGSFYEGLRNEMQRQRTVQGGVDAGYDSQMAKMARDQGNAASARATQTEADIMDRVTQGREWGAGNLSEAEKAVVDAIQRGRMYGSDQDYKNRALTLDANRGLTDVGKSYADLRAQTPGEVNMYEGLYQRGLGQGDAARSGAIGQLAGYTPSGNWFDRNRRLLGIAGGVASAFMPWLAPVAANVASEGGSGTTGGATGFGGGVSSQTGRPVRYYDPYFDSSGAAGYPPAGTGGQYG